MDGQQLIGIPRRMFLAAAGIGALFIPLARRTSKAASPADPIVQPDTPTIDAFIERAFAMRQEAVTSGDQAYGAIVVRDGIIIGQSPSHVVVNRDPTAHAEMAAIRDAAHRTGNRDLSGAMLVSSSRPCPMCEAAAYWANISEMVHGRTADNSGEPRLCR